MKKVMYSPYTKTIAAILLIASVLSGVFTVIRGMAEYDNEKEQIYGFESDFSEAQHFSHLLVAPEKAVLNAYDSFDNETEEMGIQNHALSEEGGTVDRYIEECLNNLYCTDKINYYVEINDKIYTNCGATNAQDLMQAQFYMYASRDKNGRVQRESSQKHNGYSILEDISHYDKTSKMTVCTNVKEAYVDECAVTWNRQAAIVSGTFRCTLIDIVLALLLLIYLLCVCGKNKDGEHKSMWVDNVWTEVHLAAIGGFGIGAVSICVILLEEYFTGRFPYNLMNWIIGLSVAIASTAVLTSLLSIIRNIKNKRFVESSIICRIIRWLCKTSFGILKWLHNRLAGYRTLICKTLSKKSGVILISMLLVYTALIGILGVYTTITPLCLIPGIVLWVFASVVVAYRTKDLDEIKKGVSQVKNGNVSYKIPELKSEDMKLLADNINDIAKGVDESVSAKLKAERLKTELITNVSHDLKTPLTSIISYTELLAKVEGLPDEAKDYAQIIANKSDRLKILTQDLFDISKVQSGNENVVLEKLDAALLINQSLGEHDGEMKQSGLSFCLNAPKELYISADGKKMSRVISNLINNILKYTMKNTRVFISVYEENDEVVMEFKNISSYPMDFSAEEIVGRFVRGDASRTQEGNGLGLAIAKNYTEISGGKFEVIIDGDMFKAILKFKKYN